MFSGSLLAQGAPGVYEACAPEKPEIRAAQLPGVVDEDRCPVAGRMIVDGGVGAVVPQPGMAVIAEAASPGGGQHLVVSNPRGDEVVLGGVGKERGGGKLSSARLAARASGRNPCRDPYYSNRDAKLYNYNRWYVNGRSIPRYLAVKPVVTAMKVGGANVTAVRDACGFGDGVRGRLIYEGSTRSSTDVNRNASCQANDYRSVVGFGDLPETYTAFACVWTWIQDGPNRVAQSDIRLNKADYRWTTRVTRSCRGRYDVQSTMTHERGHTFGLGEAPEAAHPNLTMSAKSNGPCQTSERSLGKGDAMGLNRKYR